MVAYKSICILLTSASFLNALFLVMAAPNLSQFQELLNVEIKFLYTPATISKFEIIQSKKLASRRTG